MPVVRRHIPAPTPSKCQRRLRGMPVASARLSRASLCSRRLFVCRYMCVRRSVFPPRPRVTPRCDGASLPRWGSFSLLLLAEKRCICVFQRKPRLLCRPKLRKRTSLLCCGFSRGRRGGADFRNPPLAPPLGAKRACKPDCCSDGSF